MKKLMLYFFIAAFFCTTTVQAGMISAKGIYAVGQGSDLPGTNLFLPAYTTPVANLTGPNPSPRTDILFVKTTPSGLGDGSSWDNAFDGKYLAWYLKNKAVDGTKIYVAAGIYLPHSSDDDAAPNSRSDAFELIKSVRLRGGFSAGVTGTDTTTTYNPQVYITRLSGDIGTAGVITDNCYNVVRISAANAFIDGFYISGGYADGTGYYGTGAGIYTSAAATLSNVVVQNNVSQNNGGGIYAQAALELNSVQITGNRANNNGGGIYADNTLTLKGAVIFQNDTATVNGGAIYKTATNSFNGSALTALLLQYNVAASGSGGAIYTAAPLTFSRTQGVTMVNNFAGTNGGAIAATNTLTLTSLSVSNNVAGNSGGAIYGTGTITLTNDTISNNKAGYNVNTKMWGTGSGAGVYAAASLTLKGAMVFENDTAATSGGGLYKMSSGQFDVTGLTSLSCTKNVARSGSGGGLYTASVLLLNKRGAFANNTAMYDGGAIYSSATLSLDSLYIHNNTAGRFGGGVYVQGLASFNSYASTFAQNRAGNGGGAYINTSGASTMENSTFSENNATLGGGIYLTTGVVVKFSTFNGNTAVSGGGALYLTPTINFTLNGNIIYGNGNSEINTLTTGVLNGNYNILKGNPSASSPFIGAGNRIVDAGKADSIFAAVSSGDVAVLAPNGGPTPTLNILKNGIAYNFVPTVVSWRISADQRGVPRPNTTCKMDAGAVELQTTDDPPMYSIRQNTAICYNNWLNADTLITTATNIKDTLYYSDANHTNRITMPVQVTQGPIYVKFITTSNCEINDVIPLNINALSTAAITSENTSACAATTVNCEVTISGGSAPYTLYYTKSVNGVNTVKDTTINSGNTLILPFPGVTESFTVTLDSLVNSTGCLNKLNTNTRITIVINPLPELIDLRDTICAGTTDYKFKLEPPVGETYSYSWEVYDIDNVDNIQLSEQSGTSQMITFTGPLTTTGDITRGGNIFISVISTSDKGCIHKDTVIVTVGNDLRVNLEDTAFCRGSLPATIDLYYLIDTMSYYSYVFYEDLSGTLTEIENPSDYPMPQSNTTLYVKASNPDGQCSTGYEPFPVSIADPPVVIIENCADLDTVTVGYTGTFVLTVNGVEHIDAIPSATLGTGYWISSDETVIRFSSNNPEVDAAQAGDFVAGCTSGSAILTYYFTDKNGCSTSRQCTITLTDPAKPVITMNPVNGLICGENPVILTATTYSEQTVTYAWYKDNAPTPIIDNNTNTLSVTEAGKYTVAATVDGCTLPVGDTAVVVASTPTVTIGDAIKMCNNDYGRFVVAFTGGVGPFDIQYIRKYNTNLDPAIYTVYGLNAPQDTVTTALPVVSDSEEIIITMVKSQSCSEWTLVSGVSQLFTVYDVPNVQIATAPTGEHNELKMYGICFDHNETNNTFQLTADVNGISNTSWSWEIHSTKGTTIDQNGLITAIASDTAMVYLTGWNADSEQYSEICYSMDSAYFIATTTVPDVPVISSASVIGCDKSNNGGNAATIVVEVAPDLLTGFYDWEYRTVSPNVSQWYSITPDNPQEQDHGSRTQWEFGGFTGNAGYEIRCMGTDLFGCTSDFSNTTGFSVQRGTIPAISGAGIACPDYYLSYLLTGADLTNISVDGTGNYSIIAGVSGDPDTLHVMWPDPGTYRIYCQGNDNCADTASMRVQVLEKATFNLVDERVYPTNKGNHFSISTNTSNTTVYQFYTTGDDTLAYEAGYTPAPVNDPSKQYNVLTIGFPVTGAEQQARIVYLGLPGVCSVAEQQVNIWKKPTEISSVEMTGEALAYNNNNITTIYFTNAGNKLISQMQPGDNHLGVVLAAMDTLEEENAYYFTDQYEKYEYLARRFKVNPDYQPSGTVTLKFYFTNSELNNLIVRSTGNDTKWDDLFSLSSILCTKYTDPDRNLFTDPNVGGVAIPVSATGIYDATYDYADVQVASFSTFYLHGGTENSALPVELLYFNANCHTNKVILNWKTATETNSDYFTIERSNNGYYFVPIGQLSGAGNSANPIEYKFIDNTIASGSVIYYRLKQTDFNGMYKYFNPVAIHCNDSGQNTDYVLYPNPTPGVLNLLFTDNTCPEGIIEIYNNLGMTVYHSAITSILDVSYLAEGIYFIKISTPSQVFNVKKFEKRD